MLRRIVRGLAWTIGLLVSATGMSAASAFPTPFNTEHDTTTSRLSPTETAASLQLPPGFKATVFAAEPDVQNPIALAWDARGRLWVAVTMVNIVTGVFIGCLVGFLSLFLWVGLVILHILCIVKGINGQRLIVPGISQYADKF